MLIIAFACGINPGSEAVLMGTVKSSTWKYCHRYDDRIELWKAVDGPVVPRTTGATCQKSPKVRKILPPKGSETSINDRKSWSAHSISVLFAIGNSSQMISAASRRRSARPDRVGIEEVRQIAF
jgi:hypothetical protein